MLEADRRGAEIDYPDLMLDEQIDGMIGEFERNLAAAAAQPGRILRLTSSTKDDLREQYRERADSIAAHTLWSCASWSARRKSKSATTI